MATLTLRILTNSGDITKGSTLSSSEMDQNLISLNNQKFEKSGDTITGNITLSGTGLRILGDFSNATYLDRLLFQTSTTNGSTFIGVIPNGTGPEATFQAYGGTDPANTHLMQIGALSNQIAISSNKNGTGTYMPITFYTSSAERVRIDTSGNVGIGINSPATFGKLVIDGTATGTIVTPITSSGTTGSPGITHIIGATYTNGLNPVGIFSYNSFIDNYGHWLTFRTTDTSNVTADRVVIGPSGNVSINSTASNAKLTVDASANASTTFYSGHFELSGSTFGASRFLLSQGSTYGLAFAQTGTSALTGRTDIQWVDVATGVTQNTPIAISGSGAVGLGTTNSGNSTLQVWQGTKNYGLEVMAATGGTNSGIASIRIINSGNTVERIGIYGESDTLSTFTYPSVIRFVQGATERVRIDASGYVGVGAVPSTKIHVYGANTASPDFANGDGVGATVYLQDTGGAGFNGGQLLFGALQGSFAGIKGELNSGTGPAGSLLFQTRGTSGNIIARMRIDTSGNVVPTSTNAYDLGTTALRWRNIYTQDLHLSNGIGDYTIVEGVENLYLVNNKTNKSFKFALIEVDPTEVPEKSKVSDGS